MIPDATKTRCLGVVMPVYYEAATLHVIAQRVLERPEVAELVIVDDCSSDGTWARRQELASRDDRVKILRHGMNRGKGVALRTGFACVASNMFIIIKFWQGHPTAL